MKILNLFLIFIQFTLCFGVDVLPHPGELPNDLIAFQLNPIEQINIVVMLQMNHFSSTAMDSFYNSEFAPTDLAIIQGLTPFENQNHSIVGQYDKLTYALTKLNQKCEYIEDEMIPLSPDTQLQLAINPENVPNFEDLRDRNKHMQNIIISAMNIIKTFVNYCDQYNLLQYMNNNQLIIQQFVLNQIQQFIQVQNQQSILNNIQQFFTNENQQFFFHYIQQIIPVQNQQFVFNLIHQLIPVQNQQVIFQQIEQFIINQNEQQGGQGRGRGRRGRGQGGRRGRGGRGQGHN